MLFLSFIAKMTHMVTTSFSQINGVQPNMKIGISRRAPRIVDLSVIVHDSDTGEILWQKVDRKLEVFGSSKRFEKRLSDIFASYVRGLVTHQSLGISISVVPFEEELPIVGF